MAGSESTSLSQQILHADVFERDGKRFCAKLTKTALIWEAERMPKCKRCIPLREILAVESEETKRKGCLSFIRGKLNKKTLFPEPGHKQLSCLKVYYVERTWNHRWKLGSLLLSHTDSSIVRVWVSSIQEMLKGFKSRPHRLLVFINPFGGKRKAPEIYEQKVRPLFELAQIETEVISTKKPDHAKEYLQDPNVSLSKFDGVICVGGDGMFNELLNGILIRTQNEHSIDYQKPSSIFIRPKLRIGVIPGGSTDAVAFCTSGTNDAVTAALHIMLGDTMGLDVSSIHSDNRLLAFCTTMLAYGYFGDMLKDSEKYRWMGPKRYDWSGVKKFLQLKHYEGEVKFHCDPQPESSPNDGNQCRAGCTVCLRAPDMVRKCQSNSVDNKDWKVIRGKFVAVNNATTTCACMRAKKGISPFAHLGDGCTDLILVKKCSRFNYLRYLLCLAMENFNPFNLNFVKVYRVREFQFRPLFQDEVGMGLPLESAQRTFSTLPSMRSSVWNCDGEIIQETAVSVKVHCQLVNIFARGKEVFVPSEPASDDSDVTTLRL